MTACFGGMISSFTSLLRRQVAPPPFVLRMRNDANRRAASPPDVSPEGSNRKLWQVGTLSYTTAGLAVLFAWLLGGDFAYNLKERAVIPVAQIMLKGFDASDFLVGLLVGSLPAALGMLLGPVVSVMSDRHRGKFGRRIPFLLLPTPFIVLSMIALGATPMLAERLDLLLGASSPGRTALPLFITFWVIFEVSSIIANVIFGALIADVVPQALVGRFFGLFRLVGLLAAILFNSTMIGYAESHYFEIFFGIALVYGGGFLVMCLRVKEGEYPPVTKETSALSAAPVWEYFRECFSLPYYRWLFAAATLGMLASTPLNSFSVFFARSLGMDMFTYGRCLVITYTVSLLVSYPIGVLADRLHPLRLGFVFIILYGLAMLMGGALSTSATTFAVFFVLHGVLAGSYFTATASIGQRLYPRLKFAQFASAWGIVFGVGFAITTPLIGLVLDASGHNYRLTFFASGGIALAAACAFIATHRRFMALGGTASYEAPEITQSRVS